MLERYTCSDKDQAQSNRAPSARESKPYSGSSQNIHVPSRKPGTSQEAEPVRPRSQAAWSANHPVKMIWPLTAASEKGSKHTLQAALRLRRFPTYRTREDDDSKTPFKNVTSAASTTVVLIGDSAVPFRSRSASVSRPSVVGTFV
jgi:hypothetical protein